MKSVGVRKWEYDYSTLASLFGVSRDAIRKQAQRKRFEPGDLQSVLDYYVTTKYGVQLTPIELLPRRRGSA